LHTTLLERWDVDERRRAQIFSGGMPCRRESSLVGIGAIVIIKEGIYKQEEEEKLAVSSEQ
jgi:hypothetical protein